MGILDMQLDTNIQVINYENLIDFYQLVAKLAQISTQSSCKSTVKVFNDGITANEESAHNKLCNTRTKRAMKYGVFSRINLVL